jgi:hypothetical protein
MAVSRNKKSGNGTKTEDSEEQQCDRRLSRAARELLKRHLIRHFQVGSPDDSLWTLLQRVLPAHVPDSCSLLSSNDALKADEDRSHRIQAKPSNKVYPISVLKHRRKSSSRRPESWFQCGYCQKIFATQYYLDLHMEEHHSNFFPKELMTCPATAWCSALGSWACDQVALELEPFYDRGSGGWGDDAVHVQHKLTKQAHSTPCTSESIKQAKSKCHELMELCHLDPTHICGSLACPNRLLEMHPHEWMEQFRETWTNEKNHSIGVFGSLLVVGLLLWYLSFWWSSIVPSGSSSRGRKDPAGRRLLDKQKSTSSASRPSRFWKTIKRKDSKVE